MNRIGIFEIFMVATAAFVAFFVSMAIKKGARRFAVIVSVIVSMSLLIIDRLVWAETGKSLIDHGTCVVFPEKRACQESGRPLHFENQLRNITGDWLVTGHGSRSFEEEERANASQTVELMPEGDLSCASGFIIRLEVRGRKIVMTRHPSQGGVVDEYDIAKVTPEEIELRGIEYGRPSLMILHPSGGGRRLSVTRFYNNGNFFIRPNTNFVSRYEFSRCL